MPTLLKVEGYRFFIYSNEGIEPPHVHVARDRWIAKFWLNPIRLERSSGFPAHELGKIERIVIEHKQLLRDKWNEYFNC